MSYLLSFFANPFTFVVLVIVITLLLLYYNTFIVSKISRPLMRKDSALARLLKEEDTAFFVGSGINEPLPTVGKFSQLVFETLGMPHDNLRLIPNVFFSIFNDILGGKFLRTLKILEASFYEKITIRPNKNHQFLAELARRKRKKKRPYNIFSACVDSQLERALEKRGLKQGRDFRVYVTNEEFQQFLKDKEEGKESKGIRIFKFNGTVIPDSKGLEDACTRQNQGLSAAKREVLLWARKEYRLIVFGYSASDRATAPVLLGEIEGAKDMYWVFYVDEKGRRIKGDLDAEELLRKVGSKEAANKIHTDWEASSLQQLLEEEEEENRWVEFFREHMIIIVVGGAALISYWLLKERIHYVTEELGHILPIPEKVIEPVLRVGLEVALLVILAYALIIITRAMSVKERIENQALRYLKGQWFESLDSSRVKMIKGEIFLCIDNIEGAFSIFDSLKESGETPPILQPRLYINLGLAYEEMGNINEAEENYNQSIKMIKEEDPNRTFIAYQALAGLGRIKGVRGDLINAYKDYQEAGKFLEEVHREDSNRDTQEIITNQIEQIRFLLDIGRWGEALSVCNQVDSLTKAIGEKGQLLKMLIYRAVINLGRGREVAAQRDIAKSIKITLELDDAVSQAESYYAAGRVFLELGEYRLALDYFMLSLRTWDKISWGNAPNSNLYFDAILGQAEVKHYTGVVLKALSSYPLAKERLLTAISLRHRLMHRLEFHTMPRDASRIACNLKGLSNTYFRLGDLYREWARSLHEKGDKKQAKEQSDLEGKSYESSLVESNRLYKDYNDGRMLAKISNRLVRYHLKKGEFKNAREYSERSISIRKNIGDRPGLAKSYEHRGLLEQSKEDFPLAERFLDAALKLNKEIGDVRCLAKVLAYRGDLYNEMRKTHQAIKDYSLSKGLFKQSNWPRDKEMIGELSKKIATLRHSSSSLKNEEGIDISQRAIQEELRAIQEELSWEHTESVQ